MMQTKEAATLSLGKGQQSLQPLQMEHLPKSLARMTFIRIPRSKKAAVMMIKVALDPLGECCWKSRPRLCKLLLREEA